MRADNFLWHVFAVGLILGSLWLAKQLLVIWNWQIRYFIPVLISLCKPEQIHATSKSRFWEGCQSRLLKNHNAHVTFVTSESENLFLLVISAWLLTFGSELLHLVAVEKQTNFFRINNTKTTLKKTLEFIDGQNKDSRFQIFQKDGECHIVCIKSHK